MKLRSAAELAFVLLSTSLALSCSPRVRVEPPSEPITINLNVKLNADVKVKLEDQAKKDVEKNPDIF